MKQLLLLLALISPSFAQLPTVDYAGHFFSTTQEISSVPIRKVSSLPATCTAVGSASSSNAVLYQGRVYQCTATNTWTFALGQTAALTSGRVPFVTTGGLLTDEGQLQYINTGAGRELAVRYNSSGYPYIGLRTTSGTIRVALETSTVQGHVLATDSAPAMAVGTSTAHPVLFQWSGTTKMNLDQGVLNIDNTASSAFQTAAWFGIRSASNTVIGQIIQAHATQSASLFETRNSSGVTQLKISASHILSPGSAAGVDLGTAILPFKDFYLAGSSGTPASNNFRITGAATGARVVTLPDATITVAGSASALTSGRIPFVTTGGLLTDSANWTFTTGASPNFFLQSANAAHVAAVFRGAASQSANLTEWQNSAGTALLSVASDGSIAQTVTKSGASTTLGTNVAVNFQNTGGFNRAALYSAISSPSGASTAWVKALEGIAQLSGASSFISSGSLIGVQGEVRINAGTITGTMSGAVYGVSASVNNQNSGVTLTTAYGFYSSNPQRTGAITNYYAYYTDALTSADYAFYSAGTGRVYIGDTTNSTSSTTGALLLSGGIGLADAKDISFGTTTGTKIGTATTQKIGFFNATPIVQPSSTGETAGFTAGAGTAVNDASTFTGNVGSTAYRISDIVKALKNLGLIAQ